MHCDTIPPLSGIDHIHVYVSDRAEAAAWYENTLGFCVIDKFRFWAQDPAGPLTLESRTGDVHLALFQSNNFTPASVLALGTDASGFMQWKVYLEQQGILKRCSDHTQSWSLYFDDPDGNSLEITCNDHEAIAAVLPV